MELSDFNTLAEAQAYTTYRYLDVDAGWLGQYFGVLGIADNIRAAQANPTPITLVEGSPTTIGQIATFLVETVQNDGSFGIDPSTSKGQYFRLIMGEILSRGLFNQSQLDFIFSSHTVESKPYESKTQAEFDEAKDKGEIIALTDNNLQHTAVININGQPSKPINIIVEQRFSKDGADWSDWHEIGVFRNVYYTQRSYETGIQESPAEYRELRAASPLTLGVSVA